jgi:hypothetical protein
MLRALHRTTLPLALLVAGWAWLAAAALARADAPERVDHALSSGLALGAALGGDAPLFGGELVYYLQLPSPRMRVALHAGAGGAPRLIAQDAWSVVGGVFFAYGKHNRLVVGASAGTQAWDSFYLHGARLASRPTYGASLDVGFEWMSSFGLFLRTTIGPNLMVGKETPLERGKVYPWFSGSLVIGYKLW